MLYAEWSTVCDVHRTQFILTQERFEDNKGVITRGKSSEEGQTMIYKTLHRKERTTRTSLRQGVNSGAPEV